MTVIHFLFSLGFLLIPFYSRPLFPSQHHDFKDFEDFVGLIAILFLLFRELYFQFNHFASKPFIY